MKKKIWMCVALFFVAGLLSGCTMRTVEQMYCPPKRSESYSQLQTVMDMAMVGLDFAAPTSGENQQSVQLADLDGDDVEEYLLFARGNSEKPLNILIFDQDTSEKYYLREVIDFSGSAFERVEYVDMDDTPGCELIVGRQVSDQIMGTVCVYTFGNEHSERLLNANYTKFLTCDLDSDEKSELMVIQPGESESARGVAVRYRYHKGVMGRSVEAELSVQAESVRRITIGKLHDRHPAVFVSSTVDDIAMVTDVFAMREDRFTNISSSSNSVTSIATLQNYYVYSDDIDDDGIMELPSLIEMRPVSSTNSRETQFLIRWYSIDLNGKQWDKLYTFHDFGGGWYLQLDDLLAERISMEQVGNTYTFYLWNKEGNEAQTLFLLYSLTGSNRDEEAGIYDRFALYRKEGTAYAAKLTDTALQYGLTKDSLINSFRLIYQDWNTGEY